MPSVNLPVTLVPNTPENTNDLNANLNAIVAALNGGLDEVNVPNLTAAFTSYKRLERAVAQITGQVAGTYLMTAHQLVAGGTNPAPGATGAYTADFAIELDPAIYAANARTTKLRLQLTAFVNNTAPAITFTAGLYPIATYGGVAVPPFIATLGAVVAGSTAAVAAPAAGGRTKTDGTDFNFPAAGAYAIAVVTSGTAVVNSATHLLAQLEMRQV